MDTLKKRFYRKSNSSDIWFLRDQTEKKKLFGLNQLQDVKKKPAAPVTWSPSLLEQDPGPLKTKKEKKERWTSQEGEHLNARKEINIKRFIVSMKSGEDGEKPHFSQLHRTKTENRETDPPTWCLATKTKTEPEEEDYKGPEPGGNPSPISDPQPDLDEDTSEASEGSKHESESDSEDKDIQQLFEGEDVPWSSSLTEQDPEPLDLTKEKEIVWTSQEGDQLNTQRETETSRFYVSGTSEKVGEKPQFSQFHKIKTGDNKETEPPTCCLATETKPQPDEKDCKVPEAGRNPGPNRNLQPHLDEVASEASGDNKDVAESKSEDRGNDWKLKPADTQRIFACSVCGKTFVREAFYRKHLLRHLVQDYSPSLIHECFRENHNGSGDTAEKRFHCSDCDKKFRFKSELYYHAMMHTGERPFGCSDCGKKYRTKGKLKDHMVVHTGEKPFICTDCGKGYRSRGMFHYHKLSHSEYSLFICRECGRKFKCASQLKSHMMTHTGEKPYVCEVCDKRVRSKHGLKLHMMLHTGEKPFPCSDCDKGFRLKAALKNHMTIHTGEKPHICGNCGKKFRSKGGLQYHKRIHKGFTSY